MIRGLYPIVDVGGVVPESGALDALDEVLAGGARVVQLRAKSTSDRRLLELARAFRDRTRASGALFIVDDRPDIALFAEADGVHLGQHDVPAGEVRRWLPPRTIIGVSCHDLGQLHGARADGAASYLGFGPIYETTSKAQPDPVVGIGGLEAACRAARPLPVVAIGGIHRARIPEVRAAGASAVAMIAGLFRGGDVRARVKEAIAAFGDVSA